jgi:hypothetical protein
MTFLVKIETFLARVEFWTQLTFEHSLIIMPMAMLESSIDCNPHISFSMKLVIFELSLIIISITEDKSTKSIEMLVAPISLVDFSTVVAHAAKTFGPIFSV